MTTMSFREVEQAGWTTRADRLLPRPSSTRRRHDGDDCSRYSWGLGTIAKPGGPLYAHVVLRPADRGIGCG